INKTWPASNLSYCTMIFFGSSGCLICCGVGREFLRTIWVIARRLGQLRNPIRREDVVTLTNSALEAVKARMKAVSEAGDFGGVARYTEDAAIEFVARRGIRPGLRVLDVACGSGNCAVPAARAGAEVVGVDIASNLLEQARARAAQEGLNATFN